MTQTLLNDKKFVALSDKKQSRISKTVFHCFQNKNIITGTYKGGVIKEGLIMGRQTEAGKLELLFQCLTKSGEYRTGRSNGIISKNKKGKLVLRFDWNWLKGIKKSGASSFVEVDEV